MRGKRESDTESEREREREEENGCEKVERIARKRTVIKKEQERKEEELKGGFVEHENREKEMNKSHPKVGRNSERKKQR